MFVILFVCHFVCTVTDFSAAEKARGVKFCMRVGLLSGQVFSLLANFDSRGVTGAALLPECVADNWLYGGDPGGEARLPVGIGGGGFA